MDNTHSTFPKRPPLFNAFYPATSLMGICIQDAGSGALYLTFVPLWWLLVPYILSLFQQTPAPPQQARTGTRFSRVIAGTSDVSLAIIHKEPTPSTLIHNSSQSPASSRSPGSHSAWDRPSQDTLLFQNPLAFWGQKQQGAPPRFQSLQRKSLSNVHKSSSAGFLDIKSLSQNNILMC